MEAPAPRERVPHGPGVNAVFRPTFTTSEGTHSAGTAFLVKWSEGRHVLLTAHHVFGREGGMGRDFESWELPKLFVSLEAQSIDDAHIELRTNQIVHIVGAKALSPTDLAAFLIADPGKAGALSFAAESPIPGARIHLLGALINRRGRMWPARVMRVTDEVIYYTFEDSTLNLNATSGAPLLDERGQVVGMNVGVGRLGGVDVFLGLPASAIHTMLSSALP
ncbi:MAG: trypsin-like peptidase domain-containing protein [Vicinamibacteria bacterium]